MHIYRDSRPDTFSVGPWPVEKFYLAVERDFSCECFLTRFYWANCHQKAPSKKENVNSLYFEMMCHKQFLKILFLQIPGSVEFVNILHLLSW